MQIGTTPMTRTRIGDDGNVTTGEIRADDHGNGKLYLAVDADIEVGDEVSYTLPNGKPRIMRITKHDVLQAPRGMGGGGLDHTVCQYEVVTARPVRQPKRVNLPDLHNDISDVSGAQFADGHYDEAVFNALKAVEDRVQQLTGSPKGQSGSTLIGKNLMSKVFDEKSPLLDITSDTANEDQKKDQREGYKFLFMGGALGLRNPRGHGGPLNIDQGEAMEMLAFASLLMRRLDGAEKQLPQPRHKQPIQKLPPGIGGAASRS